MPTNTRKMEAGSIFFLGNKNERGLFWVRDSGCGIQPQDLPKIFNRYSRFNSSNGGFGLGLNIVKKICDETKIELACHSKAGEGSQFILSWKLERGDIGSKIS